MASFGAPRPGERDASDALGCARGMVRTISGWNAERAAVGDPPVRIGIGLHHGVAVMGDVGSERYASFAVLGDTTNTANRLENLTRELDVAVVASQAFVDAVRGDAARGDAVRASGDHADELLAGFVDAGTRQIRGREGGIRLWTLKGDLGAGS